MPPPLFRRVLIVGPEARNLRHVVETVSSTGAQYFYLVVDGENAGKPIDPLLYLTIAEFEPDLLVFIPSLVAFDRTPSRECFERIRRVHGLPHVQVYTDLAKPVWRAMTEHLTRVADVAVSVDGLGSRLVPESARAVPWLELWTPVQPPDFGPLARDIDVSMVGSIAGFPHRGACIDHLKRHGIAVATGGGQEAGYALSRDDYFRLIRRSKIVINIARSGNLIFEPDGSVVSNLKGRVMEALACGALLLESRNDVTARLLSEGKDYIAFDDFDDLAAKIERYLSDEPARAAIAEHGHSTFSERYTAEIFWRAMFSEVLSALAARRA